jgi:hypothetical protein
MNKLERVISFLFSYHNKNYIIECVAKWEILLETLSILKENNSFTKLLKCYSLKFINQVSSGDFF